MATAELAVDVWEQFLEYAKKRCSSVASYENWLAPIRCLEATNDGVTLEVPNIFVKDYLLNTYKQDLCAFLPVKKTGEPSIDFVIAPPSKSEGKGESQIARNDQELHRQGQEK